MLLVLDVFTMDMVRTLFLLLTLFLMLSRRVCVFGKETVFDDKSNTETPPTSPRPSPTSEFPTHSQSDTTDGLDAAEDSLATPDGTTASTLENDKELERFQNLFHQKRMQQHEAMQAIFDKYNYEQRYKLVDMVFDRMQEIIAQSRQKLTESGYEPGMPFPTDETRKEGLSLLLENLAFFSEIALRLPDITHSLFSKKKELREVVRWGASFTENLGFLDEIHVKLLNLMSQEMRLIKRDTDYNNPFKQQEVTPETEPPKKKEKKPQKKGPRLSRSEL